MTELLSIHPFIRGFPGSPAAGGKDIAAWAIDTLAAENGCAVSVLDLPWGEEPWIEDALPGEYRIRLGQKGCEARILPTMTDPDWRSALRHWRLFGSREIFKAGPLSAWGKAWRRLMTDKRRALRQALADRRYGLIYNHQTASDLPALARAMGYDGRLAMTHHSTGLSPWIDQYDRVAFVSRCQMNQAKERFPDRAGNFSTIHFFAEDIFHATASSEPGSHGVLFVGLLKNHRKGLDLLLEAYRRRSSLNRHPLHVAGTGELLPSYRQEAEKHNLNVIFQGYCSQEKIARLMAETTVFAMPSRAEGLAWSYIEALTMGLPIVGYPPNVEELAQILKIEVGRPFDAERQTPDELAEIIDKLLADPAPSHQAGRRERQKRARAYFNRQRFQREYLRLFEELTGTTDEP